MTGREMLIKFEDLLRTSNPEIEFDVNINADLIYTFLTKAQESYIVENFLIGDSIQDNINAIRKRSDVLRKIIKRTSSSTVNPTQLTDGGYEVTIVTSGDDYWMFLFGVLSNDDLVPTDLGSSIKSVELELINHYDLSKKLRTITNEPVLKRIPIVLEGDDKFVMYLSEEYNTQISVDIDSNTTFEIIYLSYPPVIDEDNDCSLAQSTHYEIVELAIKSFRFEYQKMISNGQIKQS
jgi:hypothetical protein